jgi:hypothetical protein
MINKSQNNSNFIQSQIFNPFHGGIALGAIYAMDDLDAYETSILVFIGSKLVVHGDHHAWLKMSKREIISATKIGRSKVTQVIQTLLDKSYIYVESNFDEFNSQQENTYYLSDYLFAKYIEMYESRPKRRQSVTTPAVLRTPPGHEAACYNTSVASLSSVVDSLEAERSEEKENKNNNIELKYCGSGVEDEPLRLCQSCRNFEQKEDSGSPSDRSAHKLEEVDLGNFEDIQKKKISAKDQFEAKISQVAIDHPEYIPLKVTSSHRKMIAIFRITDPKVKKKSWVKDNDIHFFTDQVFDKYGDIAHNIIDVLYKDMKDTGKCGQIAWDINTAFKRVEIAYSRYLKMKDRKND